MEEVSASPTLPDYFRRRGTTPNDGSISEDLYDTALLSLINFRLLNSSDVVDYSLASNVHGAGAFGDICFKAELSSSGRALAAFIQTKHQTDLDDITFKSLVKSVCSSYVQLKYSRETDSTEFEKNDFFDELFRNTELMFVVNNAVISEDLDLALTPHKSSYAENLQQFIGTSDASVFQLEFTDEQLNFVTETLFDEEMTALAKSVANFLSLKKSNVIKYLSIMEDPVIAKYHVLLARGVVRVSERQFRARTKKSWRNMSQDSDLYETDDKILSVLRKKMCEYVYRSQISSAFNYDAIPQFLTNPNPGKLSLLIGRAIVHDEKYKLKFTYLAGESDKLKLDEIRMSPSQVEEAKLIAARCLLRDYVNVPVTFGHIDMETEEYGERLRISDHRLESLTKCIVGICAGSHDIDSYKIVTIDETEEHFFTSGGILNRVVGNLLVHDEDTGFLKFADGKLEYKSKQLFDTLKSKISDLHLYRFDVRTVSLPKLVFNYREEAKQLLQMIVIYKDEVSDIVKDTLEREIKEHAYANNVDHVPHNMSLYQDEIQEWCLKQETAPFLRKRYNMYQQATD